MLKRILLLVVFLLGAFAVGTAQVEQLPVPPVAPDFRAPQKPLPELSRVGVDLNNLLNTNYPTQYNTTYVYNTDNVPRPSGWGTPTGIYNPRFVRLNFTVNF